MVIQQKSSVPGDLPAVPGIKTEPTDERSEDNEVSRPTAYQRLVEVMMKKEASCLSIYPFLDVATLIEHLYISRSSAIRHNLETFPVFPILLPTLFLCFLCLPFFLLMLISLVFVVFFTCPK